MNYKIEIKLLLFFILKCLLNYDAQLWKEIADAYMMNRITFEGFIV